ncbi:phenylalanyl-tRNA synthetase subunit beta [Spiroplasma helicoides]|uniref:Phenylalanine--tRNA ligase beta subunit n=1 Tax=Spiroplasma helicoides TaxID=216938 RepID=A0A1B3SL77_9MOLU|nr:phenylalanine--tRNA ligase subunit beta [Spiroplasma helicoides]AOG60673.1 phenylalanyl-tRNA synthetase subunit beta [Spiroplasma helicoides]
MVITRNWLEHFIDLDNIGDDEITTALNSLGFEVDAYRSYKEINDSLIVGHVGHVSPMEGTSLNFCFVDLGDDLVSPIVCGATNVKEGQYVLVAPPGTTIANGMTLTKREIKGKVSEGMICALIEFGMDQSLLNEEEVDIIYPIHTKSDPYSLIGSPEALEIIGFEDSVWEVDLTLNRSDALGAFQLAKEIANYFDKKIKDYTNIFKTRKSEHNVPVSIKESKDLKNVLRRCSMQLFDIKQVSSIDKIEQKIFSNQDIWMKFSQCKTQNNFWLDLSNAIAIESGQPVILLDAEKLKTQLEIVNNPTKDRPVNYQLLCAGEVVSTLGVSVESYFLPTEETKQVLAIYLSLNPIEMRKQQKSYNSSSVFLQRWMKPISSKIHKLASDRTVYWFDQYGLYGSSTDLETQIESDEQDVTIEVNLEFINNLLGMSLKTKEIKELFKNIDFEVEEADKHNLKFKVDPNRTDIKNSADIVEEIARLYGYNNIESKAPEIIATAKSKKLEDKVLGNVESYLLGQGFNNIKSYSLTTKNDALKWDLFDIKDPVNLASPLSQYRETYRLSLAMGCIESASLNYSRGNKNIKLYEVGDVYNIKGVREKRLCAIVSGDILNQKAYDLNLHSSYAYIKGIADKILNCYQICPMDLKIENINKDNDDIHPHINAQISYKDELIGFVFKLNPRFEQAKKLDDTYLLEFNLSSINQLFSREIKAIEIPKFQKTSRVVTMLLSSNDQYTKVINTIKNDVNYIVSFKLVDIYQDEQLAEKKLKAVSVGFEFNSSEKQLSDNDVSKEWNKILANIDKLKIEVK